MRIIAGRMGNRRIAAPEGKETRPTLDRVRENLFNILQTRIESAEVLDLFAGSGALSFEALSRGAAGAVLCDSDRNASRTEHRNAEILGCTGQVEIYCCDWRTAVRKLKDRNRLFDLVFLDPPYRMTDLRAVFDELEALTGDDSLVIVEHEAKQNVLFGDGFVKTDERRWGFCGISFLRKKTGKDRRGQEESR